MNWLKAFLSFSSMERKGITALIILATLLLLLYISLPYLIKPPKILTDKKLAEDLRKFSLVQESSEDSYTTYRNDVLLNSSLFSFDPNTLDSMGFIKLGLRAKTVHLLLNWRKKGKIFYKKEDLKPLYTLKEEEYKRLEPYINIPPSNSPPPYSGFKKYEPIPEHIDLNMTDSATLVRLKGIGPVLAHKIIERRKVLGGFVQHSQLNEIYRFPDTTFKMLCDKLIINTKPVRKFNINTATYDDMKPHPYIGEKVARNIILYREGLKAYSNIEQLKQVPLMNEEIYRKIAPYFVLE